MKYGPKEFFDLLFAILQENEVTSVNINDVVETIKILYESEEFEDFTDKIEMDRIQANDIINHPFVESIDDETIINIKVKDKQKDEILRRNITDTAMLANAINKKAFVTYVKVLSNGKIAFEYDDPDGSYRIASYETPFEKKDTRIYTDGTITKIELPTSSDVLQKEVDVNVTNSTYTIMVSYENELPVSAEMRATSDAGFNIVCHDALQLMENHSEPYITEDEEKPYSYELIRH